MIYEAILLSIVSILSEGSIQLRYVEAWTPGPEVIEEFRDGQYVFDTDPSNDRLAGPFQSVAKIRDTAVRRTVTDV